MLKKYLTILFNNWLLLVKELTVVLIKYYTVNRKTGGGYESTMKGEILRER